MTLTRFPIARWLIFAPYPSITPSRSNLEMRRLQGVGRMLCQELSNLGVTVIGIVGSAEKADIAIANGCTQTILYREVDFVKSTSQSTSGNGVQVVYDSVGSDTFAGSVEVLNFCGHLVNFGQSSGPTDPIAMATLATKSLTVTRPILFHYLRDQLQYRAMADQVMNKFASGRLQAPAPMPIPLEEAAKSHEILESMNGGGSLILKP